MQIITTRYQIMMIRSTTFILEFVIGVVGLVALVLTFYILRVSQNQNLNESLWEYGQLRATGLTGRQGLKILLYEQFAVVLSSIALGVAIGVVVSCFAVANMFTFADFPMRILFPIRLTLILISIVVVTTYYAIVTPIRKVNREKISKILKGQVTV